MNSHPSSQTANDLFKDVVQSELDWTTLEGLMYKFWRKDMVKAERKRIHQCWFDYRHIHPVLRSYVFIHEYNEAHRRAFKRFYGRPASGRSDLPKNAQRSLYNRPARTIVSTLNRMHLVDQLGCPYDSYFDASFNHFMQERGFDKWKSNNPYLADLDLPPLNMLTEASTMISGQRAFEKRNTIKLRLPKHPHYHADAWVGSSNQKACSKWLINEVRNRPDRNIALARLCYDLRLIREAEVVRVLSLDTVKQMRDIKKTLLSQ